MGLEADKEFYVFEFWSKRLKGSFRESFRPGRIDPQYNCQLFCIRERRPHPQVIASNRHITCGGYDLEDVVWKDTTLSGKSAVVAGDTYVLYVTEPQGFALKDISCQGAEIQGIEKKAGLIHISILSKKNRTVSWELSFDNFS